MERGELVGSGRTSEVYAWGEDRVLKFYFAGMPRGPIEREFRTTRALSGLGLPVPAAEEFVESEGRLGIVFERLRGPTILELLESSPGRIIALSRLLGTLHARIHGSRFPSGGPEQKALLEYGLGASARLRDEAKAAARASLAALPAGDAVCHGDFHPGNVILAERGPVIIDWMTGSRGNPLADLARSVLILKTGGLLLPSRPIARAAMSATRQLILRGYLRGYAELRPIDWSALAAWRLPVAAARLFEVEGYPAEERTLFRAIEKLL